MIHEIDELEEHIKMLEENIKFMKSDLDEFEREKAYYESFSETILIHSSRGVLEIPDLSELRHERDRLKAEIELLEESGRSAKSCLDRLEALEQEIKRVESILEEISLRYAEILRDKYRRDIEELEREIKILDQVLEHSEKSCERS